VVSKNFVRNSSICQFATNFQLKPLKKKKIYEGKATSKYDYLNVTEDTKFLEG